MPISGFRQSNGRGCAVPLAHRDARECGLVATARLDSRVPGYQMDQTTVTQAAMRRADMDGRIDSSRHPVIATGKRAAVLT
jgi:hypothetical protein